MRITSPAFKDSAPIPNEYTGEGDNGSPPLVISEVPAAAKSLALIVEDPDAPSGTFTHWVLYNLPPSKTRLEKNMLQATDLADGTQQGLNDFKKFGYGGPLPPSGTHRYFFKLYALDRKIDLPGEKATKEKVLHQIKGHVLADAQLMGTYHMAGAVKSQKAKEDRKVQEASEESFPASDPPAY